MIGNPTETIKDIRMTQKFILDNDIDSYGVCITTPLPGTKLWKWCEEKHLIPKKFRWSDFNYTGGKIPVLACDTIPYKKLNNLYYETAYLKTSKGNLLLSRVLKEIIMHPIKHTKSIIRNPWRVLNVLKRVKM
jgi:hypothetical protein